MNDFIKSGLMLSIMFAIPFHRSFLFRPWAHHFHLWFFIQRVLSKSQNFHFLTISCHSKLSTCLFILWMTSSFSVTSCLISSYFCSICSFSCLLCLLVFLTSWQKVPLHPIILDQNKFLLETSFVSSNFFLIQGESSS